MNFNPRPSAKTTVAVVEGLAPRVGITSEALTKMAVYVKECSDEIGWLGTAYKNEAENTILIDDVYLFDQDVHGATTEITPEGLSDFATELLEQGDAGIEIWNNLKMWGHSHVNMGVSPSAQDNDQMRTFAEGGHDWFIRLICNKKGEMKLDLYDYRNGIAFIDLQWVEVVSEDERAIQSQIDELYAQLDALASAREKIYKDPIKEEMKAKVRKIVSHTKGSTYYQNGQKKTTQTGKVTTINSGKTNSTSGTKKNTDTASTTKIDRKGYYMDEDVLDKDDEVLNMFSETELIELSYACDTMKQLEEELWDYGYYNFFTDNDLERIFRVMRKTESKYMNDQVR